jgi:predicted acyl esterase
MPVLRGAAMRSSKALLLAGLFALSLTAGCLDSRSGDDAVDALPGSLVPVEERYLQPYVTEGDWSQVLTSGAYQILPGVGRLIDVAVPTGNGAPVQLVHMGLFFPDIPGCDFPDASDAASAIGGATVEEPATFPDECKVPVLADVGPYYGEGLLGDLHATEPANRLGRFLIENLVPHGYAVAQVSVFGTGDSGGCMDLMGEVEQAGVQAAVKYLGEAPWSNGNVGLTGRSYDGSTPWEAAMNGDPHLKTVIPISGLYGQFDLMWRNGSAEFRGPGVLWGLYYAFTYTGNEMNPAVQARQIGENALCPETQLGGAQGLITYLYGSPPAPEQNTYWSERSFRQEVLDNYEGSVYFIHGLQDWNVDPHMAFPFYNELEAKGLDVKGLFGQWGHNYPDRPGEHGHVRWDWAQDLLEWCDFYLKETGPKPQLHVEVEDDSGQWHIESTWPPEHAQARPFGLDAFGNAGDHTLFGYSDPVGGIAVTPGTPAGEERITLNLDALSETEDTRIVGLPTLHLAVTPQGPGGQVYAELGDAETGAILGHAIMDLRYHEGGATPQTVVPGQTIVARMQFFPLDGVLPAGHGMYLNLQPTGFDYLNSAVNTPVVVHADERSVLTLPLAGPGQLFEPPGWEVTEGGGQSSP